MKKAIEIKAPELTGIIRKAIDEKVSTLPPDVLREVVTMDRINLNEMLYNTVPGKKVVAYLKSGYNFEEYYDFDPHDNYGMVELIPTRSGTECIHLWVRPKDEEAVIKLMGKLGWVCMVRDLINRIMSPGPKVNGFLGLQFEKKFDDDETDWVMSLDYIYHYVPTKILGKVMHMGLVPKVGSWALFGGGGKQYTDHLYKNVNDDVEHARIYFFTGEGAVNPREYFSGKANSLSEDYTLLRISTKKLPKGIKFYKDMKQGGAVFTYWNIPPSAIEPIEDTNEEENDY